MGFQCKEIWIKALDDKWVCLGAGTVNYSGDGSALINHYDNGGHNDYVVPTDRVYCVLVNSPSP